MCNSLTMNNATNHSLTFRTPAEMAELRPFGVICMIAVTEEQTAWAARHGLTIAADYEGIRISNGRESVTARPRTDGNVTVNYHHASEWNAACACYTVQTTNYKTLCEALRALVA